MVVARIRTQKPQCPIHKLVDGVRLDKQQHQESGHLIWRCILIHHQGSHLGDATLGFTDEENLPLLECKVVPAWWDLETQ